MLRSVIGEGNVSGEQRSSPPAGRVVSSAVLDRQESSWLGLLSRPAVAWLQRHLPGRAAASRAERGWKSSFVDEEREFLRQLDDMLPLTQHAAPHLAYLQCQRDIAAGLLEPRGGSTSSWLTADSLRDMGIQNAEEMDLSLCQHTQMGYLSSVRTFLAHVLASSQEVKQWELAGGGGARSSRRWWGSFWGGEEASHEGLTSDVSWAAEVPSTDWLCPQQPEKTKASETTGVFVQSSDRGRTPRENTRRDHREERADSGGLHPVQNRDHWLALIDHLSSSGAAAACGEVAFLSPDQDNGYSSLEEEHFQVKVLSEELLPQESGAAGTEMEDEAPEEGQSASGKDEDEEEEQAVAPEGLEAPQCHNKTIAFIMGCPCSDDDSSQSEGESSDDDDEDDDDGFDSEGLSDSSSEDEAEGDEASDSEADSEAERLWSSLCQSVDPYNPRNFTARLRTVSTPPRPIPTSTPPSSTQSTPASSPPLVSSSPSGSDAWDDSTSSEVDEAESLRLWSSFSSSSDPYSPLNFQGPLRTQGPVEAWPKTRTRVKKCPPPHSPAAPPEYRKEEAEDRLDSGFSEPPSSARCSSTPSCSASKKVRFSDDVEEFFASCGEEEEDRRGPWEELARDRCRFLRRCQEVEESIAYCLQPQHRTLVYCRLTRAAAPQDA